VLEGDVLRVTSLTIAPESILAAFGDPVITFDWLMKSHALGERIPLPVSDEGAQVLEQTPLASFGPYGHRVFCAAKAYTPPAAKRPLRIDGALIAAVKAADLERVRALVAEGADVRTRSTVGGYTPLHIAIVKRDPALIELLLQLGADANQPADQHRQPLVLALVHKLAPELLDTLLAAGADLDGADHRKFGVLHAASEVGNVIGIEHMLAKGADIHARTDIGLTPLHIACALGHLAAAQALHAHGADIHAESDIGSPLDGARSEGKADVVAWLESLPIAV
jgi:ankyrin repeat protein